MENSFAPLDERTQTNVLEQKLDFVLEGIVNVIKLLDEIKKKQDSFERQTASMQSAISRCVSISKDVGILSSSIQSDIDDLKTTSNEISNKLDVVDNDILNIKIYKQVSKD